MRRVSNTLCYSTLRSELVHFPALHANGFYDGIASSGFFHDSLCTVAVCTSLLLHLLTTCAYPYDVYNACLQLDSGRMFMLQTVMDSSCQRFYNG
jgi:hypothetical protein